MHGPTVGDVQLTGYVLAGAPVSALAEMSSVRASQLPSLLWASVIVVAVMPAPLLPVVPQLPPGLPLASPSDTAPVASSENASGASRTLAFDVISIACWPGAVASTPVA